MSLESSVARLSRQAGLSRRSLLVGGALSLSAMLGGTWLAARHADGRPALLVPDAHLLGAAQQQMLAVQAEAMLGDVLERQAEARQAQLTWIVANMDAAIAVLPPPLQDETLRLLGLLAFAPSRWLLSSRWRGWRQESPDEVLAWLERLRGSDKRLQRIIFRVLRDLVTGAFYGDRRSWSALGYPGPLFDLGR